MRVRIAAALASVFLLAGCASLPDSSTPQAIGTIAPSPVTGEVPVPLPGREPNLLLRDFFAASTDPLNRHAAARQFLTPAAAERWDDAASTTIVDKVDVLEEQRNGDTATFTIRANKVGQLEPGGSYQATEGNFEAKVHLHRTDGQWRIDELPPGVIMDRPQFLKTYQRNALYFVAPGENMVVPDLRWISARQENLPERLVDLLITGPKAVLANAVENELAGLSLRAPVTKADGRTEGVGIGFGGVRIDFQGAQGLDQHQRELLAAQVVWTLATAEISGPYVLLADGKPLDERYPQGWSTADVASTNPTASVSGVVGLNALRDGALVSVTDTGVSPRPGYFGSATSLESIALSRDGRWAAGVSAAGQASGTVRTLMAGPIDGDAVPLLQGGSITRPTWSPDNGSIWAVVDGSRVVRAERDPAGQMSVQPVDSAAIAGLGGSITELRLSRDGVRAAIIVDGKVYVATAERRPDGQYQLTNPRPAAVGLGSPAVALDWSGADSVVVVRAASEIPVVMVSQDGSRMDALPSRNLTSPVDSVDASPTTVFVGDARGVFQLNNNDPASDRYWREVPGLTGVKATPVLPG
ncbi:MtrAB system accessory lipoprotein LpqB [Rhodococcus oryzae]|uniref:MtrAB system accessory lipoprotein LpqB n=1 Tax=Rhodococcus oryzae TaxID=2571143 RepID=UPI0037AB8498